MIFAEWKPLDEIMELLNGCQRVLLVGCATCVAECAAGGEKEVETLAPLLSLSFKEKGQAVEVLSSTLEKQCEWEFVEDLADKVGEVDAILSLACGIGVQALAERFADKPVFPGVNTAALTIREKPGVWAARCTACGDCILGDTFGYCPITRCAKSLLNGPCGGTRQDGKCEIDADVDCVWYLIVERAAERRQLDSLARVRKAKNWSNSRHGGPKQVIREDMKQ